MAISKIGSNAITDGAITADDLASGAVESAFTGQIGGRRNLIINGAMQVAQRGTSSTGNTSSLYQLDRFETMIESLGTWTVSQSTDAPNEFSNSLKLECTTADASPAAADYVFIRHKIEGQNLQGLAFGTSSAKSTSLSFWVKSSNTGNISVNLKGFDTNSPLIGSSVSINSANTWEYKTVTFVGNTSDALDNDNNVSIAVEFWLDAGSNWTTGTTPSAWEANDNTDRAASTTLALGDTVGNTFYLTGVQLEVGSVASSYEHRSFGEELALCQRYYQKIQADSGNDSFGVGMMESPNTHTYFNMQFFVPMRSDPTALETTGTATDYEVRVPASTITCDAVPFFTRASKYSMLLGFRIASGGTTGYAAQCRAANSSAYLAWSAEL